MLDEKKLKEAESRVKQFISEGIKIKTNLSIHAITFDAIIYYFYLTGKLQKEFLEDFIEAKEDAAELLGKQKADELMEAYF